MVELNKRCYDKDCAEYKRYGGRGVRICARWRLNVETFVSDMGQRPTGMSIDRKDNDGHYSCGKCDECRRRGWKGNCRWVSSEIQANNKSNNRRIVVFGERLTVPQAARKYKLSSATLLTRLREGLKPNVAVTMPRYARMKGRERYAAHQVGEK